MKRHKLNRPKGSFSARPGKWLGLAQRGIQKKITAKKERVVDKRLERQHD